MLHIVEIFTQIVSFNKDDVVCSALQSLEAPLLLRSRTLQLCHFLLQGCSDVFLARLLFFTAGSIVVL